MNRQKETDAYAGLETRLWHTLLRRAESVQVTPGDTERMKRSVHRKIEEDSRMRKWTVRKVVAVAAAVCVLGSITAVAAGKITQVNSQSSHANDFPYSQLGKMENKLGFVTKAPEAFSNGYRFGTGVPVERSSMDKDGNVVEKGKDVSLTYKKAGQPDLFLSVEKTNIYEESEQPDQTFDHNGITLQYNSDNYRSVPPDYQVSAEEQAKVDAGELEISYGSREVENQVVQSLSWKDGKTQYIMNTFDNSMTAKEMAQMAGEIIDNK